MSLDVLLRGFIERWIDETIQFIPTLMNGVRTNKTNLQIKEEADYVFGLATGIIMGKLDMFYRTMYYRRPSDEELFEAGNVISRRSRDIRDAIFDSLH
jgi:hypothetical protein